MQTQETIPVELQKLIPGILGSVGAMAWIKGAWPKRLVMVVLGIASSHYAGKQVAQLLGMDENLAGFLVGLFSMSVVDSVFKTWQELELTALMRDWLRSLLRLPPKE